MTEVTVGGETVARETVRSVRVETGRDVRPLVGGLASLLLGVLVPTGAVAAGVPFPTVFPLGVLLFLASGVGLALWLRSSVATLVVETESGTLRERCEDEAAAADRAAELQ
ncbi:hypothetical protein [Halosegnis marinus]|uniref:Uncharacterized protein n=1 Tax=Halosegnis marinus TaxID=3034023 RepID=A0ABD5ZL19_9EURY|nr:hypothetical protein [Halosegnis sp. DT85]